MELSPKRTEALTELINIGYGRSAAALSVLTGSRVTLEVPQVTVHEIGRVSELLPELVRGEVAGVAQIFTGPLSGNAVLLLDEHAAVMLTRILTQQEPVRGEKIDATVQEVVIEVGNILLNACLGVFGNILNVHVTFAVPTIHIEGVDRILRSICIGSHSLTHALMVHTRIQLRDRGVTGYMVIILGLTSLERLLLEIDAWDARVSGLA